MTYTTTAFCLPFRQGEAIDLPAELGFDAEWDDGDDTRAPGWDVSHVTVLWVRLGPRNFGRDELLTMVDPRDLAEIEDGYVAEITEWLTVDAMSGITPEEWLEVCSSEDEDG